MHRNCSLVPVNKGSRGADRVRHLLKPYLPSVTCVSPAMGMKTVYSVETDNGGWRVKAIRRRHSDDRWTSIELSMTVVNNSCARIRCAACRLLLVPCCCGFPAIRSEYSITRLWPHGRAKGFRCASSIRNRRIRRAPLRRWERRARRTVRGDSACRKVTVPDSHRGAARSDQAHGTKPRGSVLLPACPIAFNGHWSYREFYRR